HGGVGRAPGRLAAEELGVGGLLRGVVTFVEERGGLVEVQAAGIEVGRHVGELLLDQLEAADLRAELDSVLGVLEAEFERAADNADGARGGPAAGPAEDDLETVEALPDLAEDLVLARLAFDEMDGGAARAAAAELPVRLADF